MRIQKNYELINVNKKFEKGMSYPLSKANFKIIKFLGKGAFGEVHQVISLKTKTNYAMKILNKKKISESKLEYQVKREIELQNKCNHPNIVKLYACFEDIR